MGIGPKVDTPGRVATTPMLHPQILCVTPAGTSVSCAANMHDNVYVIYTETCVCTGREGRYIRQNRRDEEKNKQKVQATLLAQAVEVRATSPLNTFRSIQPIPVLKASNCEYFY